jgi:hypothetical protein
MSKNAEKEKVEQADTKKAGAESKPANAIVPGKATATPGAPATPVRRAPGVKEVIPMAWKLVGTSAGVPVTLLKCIERSDAESQLARLEIEGYYRDLGIFPVEDEIPLTTTRQKQRTKVIKEAMTEIGDRRSAFESAKSSSQSRGKKTAPKETAPIMVPKAKVSKEKPATKAAKKVSATKKSAKGKPAKKKQAASKSSAKSAAKKRSPAPKKSTSKEKTVKKTSAKKKKAPKNVKKVTKTSKKKKAARKGK